MLLDESLSVHDLIYDVKAFYAALRLEKMRLKKQLKLVQDEIERLELKYAIRNWQKL